jgi:hypothetical protein
MRILKAIGLGMAAVSVTGGLAFAASVWRNSRKCPHCDGLLEIESFEILGEEEDELSSRTVARCGECARTLVSENGAPWETIASPDM